MGLSPPSSGPSDGRPDRHDRRREVSRERKLGTALNSRLEKDPVQGRCARNKLAGAPVRSSKRSAAHGHGQREALGSHLGNADGRAAGRAGRVRRFYRAALTETHGYNGAFAFLGIGNIGGQLPRHSGVVACTAAVALTGGQRSALSCFQ